MQKKASQWRLDFKQRGSSRNREKLHLLLAMTDLWGLGPGRPETKGMTGRNSIPYSGTGRTKTIVDVLSYCHWNTGIRMLLKSHHYSSAGQ